MTEEDVVFKGIRRRYYQLGKGRADILVEMGYLDPRIMGPEPMNQHDEKRILMRIHEEGAVEDLVRRINEREESQKSQEAGLQGRVEAEREQIYPGQRREP